MTSSNLYCQLLMNLAYKHGVRSIYCSPGSRNAPLLLAAAGMDDIKKRVMIDERSAAFCALGESLVSQKPVMVICTSGTAVLNYAPAVAEAFYAGVPLIVVSADRPMEWIDQDDSQTINQVGVLGNIIKKSYDIPVYSSDSSRRQMELEWYVERILNDAFITALTPKEGPVHINVQLDVPLGAIDKKEPKVGKFIEFISGPGDLSIEKTKELAKIACRSRVLLLCGFMQPDDKMRKAVSMFANCFPNVTVMAETIANFGNMDDRRITMIDSLLSTLSEKQKEELCPDLVITVGGALISRQVKEWLRTYRPSLHWSVGYQNTTVDCLQSLTSRIQVQPHRFLRQLGLEMRKLISKIDTEFANGNNVINDYRRKFNDLREQAWLYQQHFLEHVPWSDFKAFSLIAQEFPKDANLFLSNGTAVRYDQLFSINSHASYCNRGVSGIDGCTSAAIGGALAFSSSIPEWDATKRQTVLITGDMSFGYDIGVLGLSNFPQMFKIIVLNNSGGGIFRFINSTSKLPEEILERYFCSSPDIDIPKVSEAFGMAAITASNEDELKYLLPIFFAARTPIVMEIKTDPNVSAKTLKAYFSLK